MYNGRCIDTASTVLALRKTAILNSDPLPDAHADGPTDESSDDASANASFGSSYAEFPDTEVADSYQSGAPYAGFPGNALYNTQTYEAPLYDGVFYGESLAGPALFAQPNHRAAGRLEGRRCRSY